MVVFQKDFPQQDDHDAAAVPLAGNGSLGKNIFFLAEQSAVWTDDVAVFVRLDTGIGRGFFHWDFSIPILFHEAPAAKRNDRAVYNRNDDAEHHTPDKQRCHRPL